MASIAKSSAAASTGATNVPDPDTRNTSKKKEIYNYYSKHLVYGMGWSTRKDHSFRLALGSFIEDYANQVEIIELVEDPATEDWKFQKVGAFDHPYPTTKIMWRPDCIRLGPPPRLEIFLLIGFWRACFVNYCDTINCAAYVVYFF